MPPRSSGHPISAWVCSPQSTPIASSSPAGGGGCRVEGLVEAVAELDGGVDPAAGVDVIAGRAGVPVAVEDLAA
jgi:hypothetical protein